MIIQDIGVRPKNTFEHGERNPYTDDTNSTECFAKSSTKFIDRCSENIARVCYDENTELDNRWKSHKVPRPSLIPLVLTVILSYKYSS